MRVFFVDEAQFLKYSQEQYPLVGISTFHLTRQFSSLLVQTHRMNMVSPFALLFCFLEDLVLNPSS